MEDKNSGRDKHITKQVMTGFENTMLISADDSDDKVTYVFKDFDGYIYRVEALKKANIK